MDINYVPFLPGTDYDILIFLNSYIKSFAARTASACSTELSQKICAKMAYCIYADAECKDSTIKASAGIDMRKLNEQLTEEEKEEAQGIVEVFETNLKMSLPSLLEGMLPDFIDKDQLTQYIMPTIAQQFQSILGGD